MSFFRVKCPKKDPLLTMLRETYHATPLKVPDTSTQPLNVIAHRGKRTMNYGPMDPLIYMLKEIEIQRADLADINLVKSNEVNTGFGFEVMGQLLKGFGWAGGSLASSIQGATEISISLENVQRLYVAPTALGEALAGSSLKRDHPAADLFIRDKEAYELLVISSVLVSKKINLNISGTKDKSLDIDLPAVKGLLGDTKVDLKGESSQAKILTFEGKKALTFAFSCIEFLVDGAGRIKLGELINPPVPKGGEVKESLEKPDPQPKEQSLMHPEVPAFIEFD